MNATHKADVYLSISKQYAIQRAHAERLIENIFNDIDISVSVDSFTGGKYPGCREAIGDKKIIITYIPHFGKRVGKGSMEEIMYGRENDLPTFVLTNAGLTTIGKFVDINKNDWSEHALIHRGKTVSCTGRDSASSLPLLKKFINHVLTPITVKKKKASSYKTDDRQLMFL